MQNMLLINNMYAAYSATSSHVDGRSVRDLSKMVKGNKVGLENIEKELPESMDKVIISKEALLMLKDSGLN